MSDDHLASLSAMGYKVKEARRALRFCAGDVAGAIDFLAGESQRKAERREERRKREVWNRERLKYGRTGSGRWGAGWRGCLMAAGWRGCLMAADWCGCLMAADNGGDSCGGWRVWHHGPLPLPGCLRVA